MSARATKKELEKIRTWPVTDVFKLIDFVYERWYYSESYSKREWIKEKFTNHDVLNWELHTAGMSYNEAIINALLDNKFLCLMWYSKWERGGHYYFTVDPYSIDYMKVAEMTKQTGYSRQYIHKNKRKFEFISIGRTKLVRQKTT